MQFVIVVDVVVVVLLMVMSEAEVLSHRHDSALLDNDSVLTRFVGQLKTKQAFRQGHVLDIQAKAGRAREIWLTN